PLGTPEPARRHRAQPSSAECCRIQVHARSGARRRARRLHRLDDGRVPGLVRPARRRGGRFARQGGVRLVTDQRVPGSFRMSEDAEKGALAQMAERLSERLSERLLWRGPPPRPAWHSFDRTPWRHPWLKPANLRRARQFSDRILAQAARIAQRAPRQFDYGFVCNMANALYERAVPLRKQGMRISLFPHPQDRFVMSQPEWEEYDGTLAQ